MDWQPCDASTLGERCIGEVFRDHGLIPFPQVHVRMLQREQLREGTHGRQLNSSVRNIDASSGIFLAPKEVSPSSPVSPLGFGTTDCESLSTDDDEQEQEEEEERRYRGKSYEISVASSSDSTYDLLNSFTNALTDCLELTIREAHVFSTSTMHHDGRIALGNFVVIHEAHCGAASFHNAQDPLVALKQGVLEILQILENMRGGQSDNGSSSRKTSTSNSDLERLGSDTQFLRNTLEGFSFGDFSIDFKDLEVGARLGSGSSGDIHRGTYYKQNVAIKILNLAGDEDELTDFSREELLRMFRQEVSTLRLARHKNLVQFIGACSCWPKLYIVTELMLGNVLETRGPDPDASPSNSDPASGMLMPANKDVIRSVQILRDAANGMDFLHRKGVMHRDLKASNLLVSDHGVVKVCDFGLARSFKATTNLRDMMTVGGIGSSPSSSQMTGTTGTVKWMAPEVLMHKAYNHKADVYSFGMVIWEVITGEVPHSGLTPKQAAHGVLYQGLRPYMPSMVPPKLGRLAQQCWDQNPQARPEFGEIAAVLEELSLELSGSPKKKKSSILRTIKSRWLMSRGG